MHAADSAIIYPIWGWRRVGLNHLSFGQCLFVTPTEICGTIVTEFSSYIVY